MWISTHSKGWYPTLIEIEEPNKRIYTKKGTPSAQFVQAKNQLEQWRTWFNDPANVQQFIQHYRVPEYMTHGRQMKLHMILIYGRRAEIESDALLSKGCLSLMPEGMELVSYDRLACDRELAPAITVKLRSDGKYEAVCIPPTFTLGPDLADRLLKISGIEGAIDRATFSSSRKQFLKTRLNYWRLWERKQDNGLVYGGDRE